MSGVTFPPVAGALPRTPPDPQKKEREPASSSLSAKTAKVFSGTYLQLPPLQQPPPPAGMPPLALCAIPIDFPNASRTSPPSHRRSNALLTSPYAPKTEEKKAPQKTCTPSSPAVKSAPKVKAAAEAAREAYLKFLKQIHTYG